jgi:two-component system NtrC family sensor kinase
MKDELKKANAKLMQWGKTLEKRVEQRTQELQNMQNFMIQSEKMASLGKMAAGVAHEINNPLTSILINAHLLMEKTAKNSLPYENLSLIVEETTRCSDIVKGLLEFSRQSPPQKNPVNVNHLISHTVSILENQMAFQNIAVHQELGENLPAVEVDTNKIKQVFWNLMINASEAMPEGGTLIITSCISDTKQDLEISFKDTGVGIKKENLNKLFDPFFTTKSGGTGLGLAVIFGIIQQHGGKIQVQSEVAHGSTFTISLPLPKTR